MISERDDIINKINNVESVVEDINMILDALTPISKDLAIDLLVKKKVLNGLKKNIIQEMHIKR